MALLFAGIIGTILPNKHTKQETIDFWRVCLAELVMEAMIVLPLILLS